MVNSPHNPTGMVLDRDDMRELAASSQDTDAFVVSDEVYEHIVFDGAPSREHGEISRDCRACGGHQLVRQDVPHDRLEDWVLRGAGAARAEIARVHQFVTYAVNAPIQRAYAEFVTRDPMCADVTPFYQAKRDLFLELMQGSRFRPLACRGTFFQMVDYSAITDERDADFAMRLIKEHGVAAIPISPFLSGAEPGPVLRFCFAKRDETLEARRSD